MNLPFSFLYLHSNKRSYGPVPRWGEKGCSAGGRGYCLLVATKPKAIIAFGVMHNMAFKYFTKLCI